MVEYNKTPSQIEKETGRKFTDIIREMEAEGLSYTEIAIKLKLKSVKSIYGPFRAEKIKDKDSKQFLYPSIRFKPRSSIEKLFPKLANVEYKDFLYQKYIIEKMSIAELEDLLGLTAKTLCVHLKYYGLSKTYSESRMDAIAKGTIDYNKILPKISRTREKSAGRSNNQEFVRILFKEKMA